MTLGEFIAKVRSERSLSQRNLALKTGLSNSTISRIENGDVVPDTATLIKLADALNIEHATLLSLCGVKHSGHYKEDSKNIAKNLNGLDDLTFALAGEVKDLTDEQKKSILAFAKLLKEQEKKK